MSHCIVECSLHRMRYVSKGLNNSYRVTVESPRSLGLALRRDSSAHSQHVVVIKTALNSRIVLFFSLRLLQVRFRYVLRVDEMT